MKKLLILAYDFPPYVSVGGLRPYAWYKYLKEFGVEPIVVTRNWENKHGNGLDYISGSPTMETVIEQTAWGTLIRTPYKPTLSNKILLHYGEQKFRFFRKVLTAFDEVKQFITVAGPKKKLYVTANNYLKKNKVDAIIATGDPFVLFFYANKLSSQFDIPWMADYRDPWSDDKKYKNKLYHRWIRKIEICNVSGAFSIITVSEFLKFKLKTLFPQSKIHVFPNGYDPEMIDKVISLPQTAKCLTITFVGTIYEWHPWKSFIKVFSDVVEQNEDSLKLNFYGINNSDEVADFIRQFPKKTQHSISIFPKMINRELLEQIVGQNIMLLFNDYSIRGTKIYDYLVIKRRILLCYGKDSDALYLKEKYYNIEEVSGISNQLQADLIQETNSGVIAENELHLKSILEDFLEEFSQIGRIECNSTGVENYSRKIQVEKLAEIVKNITK